MKKLISIIVIGFIVVSTLINLYYINNLDRLIKERIEVLDVEHDVIVMDSVIFDTVFIERYDTVRLTKCQVDTLVINDSILVFDSVDVILPINTYEFDTTLNQTHINLICEGFDVVVKDLYVESILSIPTQEKTVKTNRFGLGLQLGIGVNEKGFTPYIGVGLNYNLIQF